MMFSLIDCRGVRLECDLCLFELSAHEVVLALLEKHEATLVSEAAIVALLVDVRIGLLYLFKGAEVVLDRQKKVEEVLRS